MKTIYLLLTGLAVTAVLYLSPRMEHKTTHVTSVSHHVNGKVEVTLTAAGAYQTKSGGTIVYGITTTGEPISALIDKRTETEILDTDIQAERSYVVTGDIIDRGFLKADTLEATKTIPTPHETMNLCLDTKPLMQVHKGHQYRYTAQLNRQEITLVSTLDNPGQQVVGYWQPNRRNTFVIIG